MCERRLHASVGHCSEIRPRPQNGPFLILSLFLSLCFTFIPFSLQAQEHKTGAIFDPATYKQVPYKSTLTRGLYTVPPKASVKQFAPYSGDQGQYSTCTAWASAYSAVTIMYAKLNGITDRGQITQSAFSPGFAFRESFSGSFFGCTDGQVIAYVLQAIQKNGVPPTPISMPSVRAPSQSML